MTGTCACGRVSLSIAERPGFINDCNCSLCRKFGGAWSYLAPAAVVIEGETATFTRSDRLVPLVEIHFCPTCGVATHFAPTARVRASNPDADVIGVNMRLMDPDDLAGVEVRYPDGKDWSGVGAFGYRRSPTVIGDQFRW